MHRQLDALHGIARLPAQAGALRGGYLADIGGAVEKEDVSPAGFGQRVGHAETDGAAADDDEFG